ncbi:ABC transporter permease [Paenibacillus sp. CAA11]|uniref:ABC transporter permease n=1 Tax=Paenibacillus sp. CAA11 TaxID=1532905 RepID=UPI000D3B91D0|nr:ABC transporter permease [Paenibacillus sp. CAA11]AWB43208.1 ABC transporter permease [Paenibacillus sp. CAA11]
MMKFWTIAWFELLRLMRNRTVLFIQFLLPIVIIYILGNALAGDFSQRAMERPETVKVMLVGEEGQPEASESPGGLSAFLSSSAVSKWIQTEPGKSRDEAVHALREEHADYAVVIPADFEERLMQGQPVSWELLQGSSSSKNLVANQIFSSYLDQANRIQASLKVLGSKAASQLMQSQGNAAEAAVSAELSREGKSYTAFQYYSASMLIMFLLYSGLSASISLSSERTSHTLYRLGSMPVSPGTVFGGKILGNSLMGFLQALVIVGFTKWVYGVDWGMQPLLLALLCFLVVLCSMFLAVTVSLFVHKPSSARAVIQTIIVAMTALSGGFTPLPVELINRIGEFTPSHWAMQGILRMMLYENQGQIMYHVAVLGGIAALLLIIGMSAYRKVGYHE